jgi:hypothetical protein
LGEADAGSDGLLQQLTQQVVHKRRDAIAEVVPATAAGLQAA